MPTTSTPMLAEPLVDTRAGRWRTLRVIELAVLAIAAIFMALHFVHLRADFPNYSFWKDWAKFTDEGWYGDGAIRLYQTGRWDAPGDFNPAAALPVWPLIEVMLFRITGVSLVAGRALMVVVFALTLAACYWFLRHWMGRVSLGPAVVVALLAVSPFCFVFTRIAILEPLLILEMVAALLVVSIGGATTAQSNGRGAMRWVLALGVLLPVMILTKTTAVFLFPAIFWMLWAAMDYRLSAFLRMAVPSVGLGAALWSAYYWMVVRPHYLVDYRYLFDANSYTGFRWNKLGQLLFDTTFDGIWIGKTLFALSLIAIAGAVISLFAKGLRAYPVQVTMLVWIVGYSAFMAYHANLQPRYYLVVAIPMTILVVVVLEPLFIDAGRSWRKEGLPGGPVDVLLLRLAAAAAGTALLFAGINAGRQTLGFVLHPEYTFVTAAERVREAVDREAVRSGHSKVLLSISGADISLMTGLISICDDFGTMTLNDRIAAYKPGWFATWNEVEDDKMEALAPKYRLERVVTVPAFDDSDRNLLILYRLDPVEVPGPEPPARKRRNTFVLRSQRKAVESGSRPSPVSQ